MADPNHDRWLNTALGLQLPPRAASGAGGASAVPNLLDISGMKREMDSVCDYLRDHRLMRYGDHIMLDSNSYSIDEATQLLIQKLHLTKPANTVSSWIRGQANQAPDFLTLDQGGQKGSSGGSAQAPQYQLTYSFVPVTGHVDSKTGQVSADGPQHQATFAGNIALHPDGHAGPELAWQVQVAADAGTFKVANILQGLQAAWVVPFLDGALQLSAIATAAAGVAAGQPTLSGSVAMVPAAQAGVGGQMTYNLPGTGGKVQIGFQVAATVTAQQGSNPTADLAPQGFLQIVWH
jgi:hypothetical protein